MLGGAHPQALHVYIKQVPSYCVIIIMYAKHQPTKTTMSHWCVSYSTVIKGGDYMKIIKMDDPDRLQMTLD